MSEEYENPWWSRKGIKERWDEERNTGPPKVILAKIVREGGFPSIIALIPTGILYWYTQTNGSLSLETIPIILSVFGGVFAFFYFRAGFRDSAIRDD